MKMWDTTVETTRSLCCEFVTRKHKILRPKLTAQRINKQIYVPHNTIRKTAVLFVIRDSYRASANYKRAPPLLTNLTFIPVGINKRIRRSAWFIPQERDTSRHKHFCDGQRGAYAIIYQICSNLTNLSVTPAYRWLVRTQVRRNFYGANVLDNFTWTNAR